MTTGYLYFLFGLGASYLIQLAGKKIFCRGRMDHDGWMTFNLSKTAEITLLVSYTAFSLLNLYYLLTETPIWYNWIIPVFVTIYFISQISTIYSAMNYFIKINGNQLTFRRGTESEHQGEITISTWKFRDKKSDSIIGGYDWLLEIRSQSNDQWTTIEFNLNEMNLNGFKDSIEAHLKEKGIKEFSWNS
jgi:hypothetical protein